MKRATPPNSQSVIPSISIPSRRAWTAWPSSCSRIEAKKTREATTAMAKYVLSPSPGLVSGKIPVASVHISRPRSSSTLQFRPILTPAIVPSEKLSLTLPSVGRPGYPRRRVAA